MELRKLMREKGITQKKLAEVAMCSSSSISGYFSGRCKPRIGQARRLAAALGITLDELLDMMDDIRHYDQKPTINPLVLRRLMAEKHITQNMLAQQIGRSLVMISRYCTCSSSPHKETLERMAEALGTTVETLTEDVQPDEADEDSIFDLSAFSDRIRRCMRDKGIMQWELAEQSGISPSCLSRYVSGTRGRLIIRPNRATVEKIARSLGTTTEYLLTGYAPDGKQELMEQNARSVGPIHTLNKRISFLMAKKMLTQSELADQVGCSRISAHAYIHGKSMPRAEQLQKIADALDISANDLTAGLDVDAQYRTQQEALLRRAVKKEALLRRAVKKVERNVEQLPEETRTHLIRLLTAASGS